MRNLSGRFNEIDISDVNAKEKMRSSPILDVEEFNRFLQKAPSDPEKSLYDDQDASD
jgi:hypothetical protein